MQLTLENLQQDIFKLDTLEPRNSAPWYIPNRNAQINSLKDTYKNVHASLFMTAKSWKQPKCASTVDVWQNQYNIVKRKNKKNKNKKQQNVK